MSRPSLGGPRRHVILPQVVDDQLVKLSKRTGLTVSEHIRRAIDSYFRLQELAQQRSNQQRNKK